MSPIVLILTLPDDAHADADGNQYNSRQNA